MITLFAILSVAMLVISIILLYKTNEDGWTAGIAISAFVATGTVIATIVGIVMLATSANIAKKIEMCEEENIVLEQKIDSAVQVYLDHEGLVYDLEDLDATTLLIVLPELNGNELVKSQIQTYVDNCNEIKKLKERKINLGTWKFLVYFGG